MTSTEGIPATISTPVTFHLTDDPKAIAVLRAKAREIDEEQGAEIPDHYTVEQALQVVFHGEPAWLFSESYAEHGLRILWGWTFDRNVWSDPA
jgi:hypothetical protein